MSQRFCRNRVLHTDSRYDECSELNKSYCFLYNTENIQAMHQFKKIASWKLLQSPLLEDFNGKEI